MASSAMQTQAITAATAQTGVPATLVDASVSGVHYTSEFGTNTNQDLKVNLAVSTTNFFYDMFLTTGGNNVRQLNITTRYFTPTNTLCIVVPVTYTFTNLLGTSPATNPDLGGIKNSILDDPTYSEMADWALTRIFVNAVLSLGNSSVQIGSAVQNTQPGITTNAHIGLQNFSLDTYEQLVRLGTPKAFGGNQTGGKYANSNLTGLDLQYRMEYAQMLNEIYLQALMKNSNATPPSPLVTETLLLKIPIYFLNTFFASDSILPPGLVIKMDIVYNSGPIYLLRNAATNPASVTVQVDPNATWYLCGTGHTLNQSVMAAYNRQFMERPLSIYYPYPTVYDFPMNGALKQIEQLIQVNNAAPTQILIYPYIPGPAADTPQTITSFTYLGANVNRKFQWDTQINQCIPYSITYLQVTSGATVILKDPYTLKPPNSRNYYHGFTDTNSMFMTDLNVLNRNTNAKADERKPWTSTSTFLETGPAILTIDPKYFDYNNIGTPQGPTQIQVSLFIQDPSGQPLPANCSVRFIITKMANVGIYGNGDVTQITFPQQRINSGGGSVSTALGNIVPGPAYNTY